MAEKHKATLKTVCENGLTIAQNIGKKISITYRTIDVNGLTRAQNKNKKTTETLRKVGEDGLTGFERNFKNGAGKACKILYYNSELYYQGKQEKKFLDTVSELDFIDKLHKPENFLYKFDGKEHIYHPDFQFNNLIFEIKSTWTYDRRGVNLELRKLNNTKWSIVIEKGYEICIIWDVKWFSFLKKDDLENLETDLYSKKNEMSKSLLYNIFKDLEIHV